MKRSKLCLLRFSRKSVLGMVFLCALALFIPGVGLADETPVPLSSKVFDITVMRPLGATQLVVGSVLLVPISLLAWAGGRAGLEEPWDVLVETPYRDTFEAPLGRGY